MFNANAVFPIDGLAAKITISQPFKPPHLSSKSLKPNCNL
jgi:hypothetical protein